MISDKTLDKYMGKLIRLHITRGLKNKTHCIRTGRLIYYNQHIIRLRSHKNNRILTIERPHRKPVNIEIELLET